MSSDNHRAYVAIPMDMFHASTTRMESDEGDEGPFRCRSYCLRRNYLLPKCLGVAAVCILLLVTFWMARNHHSLLLDEYGWNEIAHDTTTYGEDVVVWHDGVDDTDNVVIDEKWLVDENGKLIYNEEQDESHVVVFDSPQDEYIMEEEEVWYAQEVDYENEEEVFDAVDEPLQFFESSKQEENVDIVDNVVEMPGLP